MKVTQILNQKGSNTVETIAAEATLADAARTLSKKRIGALVVTDEDGNISGIVSERDVVRHVGADGPSALSLRVRSAMTSHVECCAPDEDALHVLDRMTKGRFRHMPVVEGGRMAGLLSIGDVVKARIDEIEAENEAMAHMLSG